MHEQLSGGLKCLFVFVECRFYLDNVDDSISRLTPSEHFSVEDDENAPLSALLTKHGEVIM